MDRSSTTVAANKRRYHAALIVAQEEGSVEPLPCAIMEAGDDAAALEASLIEKLARLDPDEVTRWETFTRLVKEGRSPEDISLTFGLTALQVKRTLALGNLLPRIRNLYRSDSIDAVTVRHLTLASKARQREWLALLDDEEARPPMGHYVKSWLLGGNVVPVSRALFDMATCPVRSWLTCSESTTISLMPRCSGKRRAGWSSNGPNTICKRDGWKS